MNHLLPQAFSPHPSSLGLQTGLSTIGKSKGFESRKHLRFRWCQFVYLQTEDKKKVWITAHELWIQFWSSKIAFLSPHNQATMPKAGYILPPSSTNPCSCLSLIDALPWVVISHYAWCDIRWHELCIPLWYEQIHHISLGGKKKTQKNKSSEQQFTWIIALLTSWLPLSLKSYKKKKKGQSEKNLFPQKKQLGKLSQTYFSSKSSKS